MSQRVFGFLLLILLLFAVPGPAPAGEPSCTLENTEGLAAQTKQLCQLQCALQKQTGTNFSSVSPSAAACESARAEIDQKIAQQLWPSMAGCAAGAWASLTENLINVLAPEDFRRFVSECSKDVGCRRQLARGLETYRARGAAGEYQITDAELDRITPQLDFNDLWLRSRHNQGLTMDACQRELGNITRRLSSTFAATDDPASSRRAQQARFDELAAFDADCPKLLRLTPPGAQSAAAPDLTRAGRQALQVPRAVGASIQKWFQDLGIAYECYDGKTRGELLCHALGGVLLDPLAVGGGGVFAAKALARAGVSSLPKLGARFSRIPMNPANVTDIASLSARKAGETEAFVVKFQDDSRALFKPCNARDPLVNCRGEVLAYQMDQRLGLNLVPETVESSIPVNGVMKHGSLQRWAEDVRPGLSLRASPRASELEKQSFFDYLIRNIDRHQNNYLVAGNGQVVSIDHGVSFRDVSVSSGRRSGHFDEAAQNYLKSEEGRKTLANLRSWNPKETRAWLGQYLNAAETENTMRRLEFLRRYDPDKPNPSAAPSGTVRERSLQDLFRDQR